MSTIEQSIEVEVPLRTAYNQWTQFEEFPHFMEGVESVRQIDDTHLEWTAEIAGARRQWRAEITEQQPDERVAWRATKVMLQLDVEPEGMVEQVGDKLGFVKRRAAGDLERFKAFIEERGAETGAWRGEVDTPQ